MMRRDERFADAGAGWRWAAGIVALGLAARIGLFISGRTPFDGDEGIMGIMGLHVLHAVRFPLYFYNQNYMGTLEIPPVAALMALGGEGWWFSVWPVRVAQLGFVVLLGCVHYRLVTRFFGRSVGLWSLFFICVGPFFWMDFTSRLRHATLMIALGELSALLTIGLADAWKLGKAPRLRSAFVLGLVVGLGWWHYQLIMVLLAGTLALAFFFTPIPRLWLARDFGLRRPAGWSAAAVARTTGLLGLGLFWAALSTGIGARLWPHLGWVASGILLGIALLGLWAWSDLKSGGATAGDLSSLTGREARFVRLGCFALATGFVAGFAPAVIYLLGIDEAPYTSPLNILLEDIPGRIGDFLMLEVTGASGLMRPADRLIAGETPWWGTSVLLALYGGGGYLLARKAISPTRTKERMGSVFYLIVLMTTVLLNVLLPRHKHWTQPRFILPLFAVGSVLLGQAFEAIARMPEGFAFHWRRIARIGLAGGMAALGLWVFVSEWRAHEAEAMAWPSGHRARQLAFVQELERRGIDRANMEFPANWSVFGYELAYMSRLGVRINRDTIVDRLAGYLDESRYTGPLYLFRDTRHGEGRNRESDPSRWPPGAFLSEGYLVWPEAKP